MNCANLRLVECKGEASIQRPASLTAHDETFVARPPLKWAYRKVMFWSVLVFLCGGWLVFYVNTVGKNATTVISPALTGYAVIAAIVFAFMVALVVRHNISVYPKRFAEWDRSFICERCGALFKPS